MDVLLLGIPLGIIGARLYFVAFSWDMFKNNLDQIFTLQMEGLAIYGAVIGGLLAVFILSKWKKISFWDVTDAAVPSLILAQALGRWGNFFNQEVYGAALTSVGGQVGSHLALFPPAVFIDATQTWHVALFLYESVFNLCIFGNFAGFLPKKAQLSRLYHLAVFYPLLLGASHFGGNAAAGIYPVFPGYSRIPAGQRDHVRRRLYLLLAGVPKGRICW